MTNHDGPVVPRRNSRSDLVVIMGMGLAGVALAALISWLFFGRDASVTRGDLPQVATSSKEASQTPAPDMRDVSHRIGSLENTISLQAQELAAVKKDIENLQRQQAALTQTVITSAAAHPRPVAEPESEKTGVSGETRNPPASTDNYKGQESPSGQARDLIERSISDVDTNIKTLEGKLSAQRQEYEKLLADAKEEDQKGGSGGIRPPGRGPVYRKLFTDAEAALSSVKTTEQQLSAAIEYKKQLIASREKLQPDAHP